jgi:hypothetical protein
MKIEMTLFAGLVQYSRMRHFGISKLEAILYSNCFCFSLFLTSYFFHKNIYVCFQDLQDPLNVAYSVCV